MARLFISAAHKSSGKTTLSIGLCAAWRAQDLNVQPFKKGPDYIDPLWLSAASGRSCHNLDFNTMSPSEILHSVQHYGATADISVLEANKGLYDGMALDGADSNAALAKLTQSPVILVLDTRGMTRGIVPLLMGYLAFDREVQIAGVILNRVGGARHATKLRQAVEYFTDVAVLGCVQESAAMAIEERHLGLIPSNEAELASLQINRIRDQVADQVDLGALRQIADCAMDLPRQALAHHSKPRASVRIGICQDAAFGFYYASDIEALRQAGAELVPINTLRDAYLPDIDGLLIGGGFPETHLQALSANRSLRESIRTAIEAGLPTYAECGGLMYLTRQIVWKDNKAEMVGVIPADAVMQNKPQGRGYVRIQETAQMPWGGASEAAIQAHEFHYSRLENIGAGGTFAYKVLRGTGIDGEHDGWIYKNLLASYTHLRHTAQYPWANRFVDFVKSHRRKAVA
ncbi:cobyrinate a,c-diamide synthase [Thiolinea disciformis]|uniref:cobyrinate a,c-diamide synthase n=1 Tax=Thiolinea disciformis TaxID=125614 RepID=UPI000362FDF2|nr:cobyrinate a,c-diamide synthase [Thiolinea disciformis]